MTKYRVVYDDGYVVSMADFDVPERLPQPGDIYQWTRSGRTLGNRCYEVGDRMVVVGRTQDRPHHRLSALGNLVVHSKYGSSVWTQFDDAVANGSLELVDLTGEGNFPRCVVEA